MMAQFFNAKAQAPDSLLFYRMGDFYELFFEDAERAAAALDITLTKRGKNLGEDVPMAGVPVHSADMYLARLIRHGFKVAVCEQTEDPAEAKKRGSKAVVRREIVRLVTPGTVTEDNLLESRRHNFLAALGRAGGELALALADMTTGDFWLEATSPERLETDLARIGPSEIVMPDALPDDDTLTQALFDWRDRISPAPGALFDSRAGESRLKSLLKVHTLDGMGQFSRADLAAAGGLIGYLEDTQKGAHVRLKAPQKRAADSVMSIDAATRRSLELTVTQTGDRRGSLLATLDHTLTGAGGRLLAERLNAPLRDPAEIRERLDSVASFLANPGLRETVRDHLRRAPDMERAMARLSLGRGGPRDLAAIGAALGVAARVSAAMAESDAAVAALAAPLKRAATALGGHQPMADLITRALVDEPPVLLRDGGFIRRGYSDALDEFRTLRDESRRLLMGLEADYRKLTGIANLKIKHNNVLGYHVDVSAKQAEKLMAPPHDTTFIHRQTLANAVRFSTTDLSKLAGKISEAGDRALATEQELFEDLCRQVLADADALSHAARALAVVDVAAGLAALAAEKGYCRPEVDDSQAFSIEGGRHPVVENALGDAGDGPFVANDCDLGADQRLWLVTGPNMAGKSTFLRQNALIAIMAQMGSYVPAASAHIGVVDQLFSRVGASDDLAHGRSTFMVEMVETAAILNQAGPKSLVVLDEIGRGTATYDGLSIAWAAVENLHDVNRSRALFATHYHELTALKETLDALSLHAMKVREWQGEVIFLHEVGEGAADRSYGIQVARLAGLPEAVIARARTVLDTLESSERNSGGALSQDLPLFQSLPDRRHGPATPATDPAAEAVAHRLRSLNPDTLTPREALELLYELRDSVDTTDGHPARSHHS
ncbi:DNA mismatch repair protein MutS [Yunchengibacter salinarum]|uniref:DNA mismatch repair protein MutS n=1 Tax=Yunchengibacter salinarum TaxID=3133399 RepID=UPI0035B65E98